MRGLMDRGIALGIEHHLCQAGPVTEVNEHDHSVVPTALHPAVQHDRLTDMRLVQFAAPMSPQLHATLSFLITRCRSHSCSPTHPAGQDASSTSLCSRRALTMLFEVAWTSPTFAPDRTP